MATSNPPPDKFTAEDVAEAIENTVEVLRGQGFFPPCGGHEIPDRLLEWVLANPDSFEADVMRHHPTVTESGRDATAKMRATNWRPDPVEVFTTKTVPARKPNATDIGNVRREIGYAMGVTAIREAIMTAWERGDPIGERLRYKRASSPLSCRRGCSTVGISLRLTQDC